MKTPYILKVILSLIALSLWITSLILPVSEESGAGRGNFMSGGWVLFWTFTWGLMLLIGIPWAILNVGLFVLLFVNLSGRRYRWLSIAFITACGIVTALTAALAFYGVEWRFGMFFWIASMYLIGFAALIELEAPPRHTKFPRAT
jgi:hypothetical protein